MTYSRRKRLREQAGLAAELRVGPFGRKLLTQIFQLIEQIDQQLNGYGSVVAQLVAYVREDKGEMALGRGGIHEQFYSWWMYERQFADPDHDLRLDVVELAFSIPFDIIRSHVATEPSLGYSFSDPIRKALQAINARMQEDGFGYQMEGKQLVEVKSQFLHEEAIEPVLGLLRDPAFAAPDQEFRDALAEYRSGNYDDCIADCGNAFESVLKVIAAKKAWEGVKPSDRASKLLDAAVKNELIPSYMLSQFTALREVLTGIATVRNNAGGHGAGTEVRAIPKHLAAYQVNQTASAILFLADCADLR